MIIECSGPTCGGYRDNTDCIAITSLTGPGGSQWFDEDRLCVYLRFARHRVDTSKHSSCDFVLKTGLFC